MRFVLAPQIFFIQGSPSALEPHWPCDELESRPTRRPRFLGRCRGPRFRRLGASSFWPNMSSRNDASNSGGSYLEFCDNARYENRKQRSQHGQVIYGEEKAIDRALHPHLVKTFQGTPLPNTFAPAASIRGSGPLSAAHCRSRSCRCRSRKMQLAGTAGLAATRGFLGMCKCL